MGRSPVVAVRLVSQSMPGSIIDDVVMVRAWASDERW